MQRHMRPDAERRFGIDVGRIAQRDRQGGKPATQDADRVARRLGLGEQRRNRVQLVGAEAHVPSDVLRASTVIGGLVSAAISGSANSQPLASVMRPPHMLSFSIDTTGSSRSFFGT